MESENEVTSWRGWVWSVVVQMGEQRANAGANANPGYYATRDSGSACDEMVSMEHKAQMVDGIPSTLPKTRDRMTLGWVGEHWTRVPLVNGRDYPESLTLAHHALVLFPSLRLGGTVLHTSARETNETT